MEKQMETNSSILAWENPMDGGSWGSNSPWGLKTVGHDLVTKMTKKKNQVHYIMGFPGGSDGKVSACNAGDSGSIPGSGRSPGEENGYSH